MFVATAPAALALQAFTGLFNGAMLTIYSGTRPATPETPTSGNLALCQFQFATPAFGSASFSAPNELQTASFVSASVTPSNSGTATWARATLTPVVTNGGNWQANTAYSLGNIVANNNNYYVCIGAGTSAASGGPTTTVLGIKDNTAFWNYIGASTGQGNVLADFTVGTSAADIIIGQTQISTSVNVSITSCQFQIPAT